MKIEKALQIADQHSDCVICRDHANAIREMQASESSEERRIVGLILGNLKRHIGSGKHFPQMSYGGRYGVLGPEMATPAQGAEMRRQRKRFR